MKNRYGIKENIIKKKSGGGCLVIFGLPFFLAGMFVMLGGLGVLSVKIDPNQPRIFFIGFGAIFTGVGAVLMFGRAGLIIERDTNRLIKWWGLGTPMKTKEYSLSLFEKITIGRERRKSGKSSRTVYPVRLEGGGGVETIEYEAPVDYQEARRIGEDLSKFLGVNLEDTSSGKKVIREPDALDETLRDKIQRTGKAPDFLSAPYDMRSRVQKEDSSVVIEIPPTGFKSTHLFHVVPAFIFASLVGFFFLRPFMSLPTPDIVRFVFIAFILLFFIILPIITSLGYALGQAHRRYKICVTPNLLRVEEKRILRRKMIEIPGEELEELELVDTGSVMKTSMEDAQQRKHMTAQDELRMQRMLDPNSFFGRLSRMLARSGIIARSDRQTVQFGKSLSAEELKYIHDLILQVMVEE